MNSKDLVRKRRNLQKNRIKDKLRRYNYQRRIALKNNVIKNITPRSDLFKSNNRTLQTDCLLPINPIEFPLLLHGVKNYRDLNQFFSDATRNLHFKAFPSEPP